MASKKEQNNEKFVWLYWLILTIVFLALSLMILCSYNSAEKEFLSWQYVRIKRPFSLPILTGLPNEKLLQIITYDQFNQAVHPDLLYFKNKFHGHYFYLTFTPYPFSLDQYENPSILYSDDGVNFKEEINGLNPLIPTPALGHNDDPDLFFDYNSKQFWLYYLQTLKTERQFLIRLVSSDGVDWQKEKILEFDLKRGDDFILSPALIEKDEYYYLFVVNKQESFSVGYYQSIDGKSWNKDKFNSVQINFPDNFTPWHLDVFYDGKWYYALINGGYVERQGKQELLIARSLDLNNWEIRPESIIKPGVYNSELIYRSTGLSDQKELAVWFSFKTQSGKWQIGFKKFKLAELF